MEIPKWEDTAKLIGPLCLVGTSLVLLIDISIKNQILKESAELREAIHAYTYDETSPDEPVSGGPVLDLYPDTKSAGVSDGPLASKTRTRSRTGNASRASKDSERLPESNVSMERVNGHVVVYEKEGPFQAL